MGKRKHKGPRDPSLDPRQGDPVRVPSIGLAAVSKPPKGHEKDIDKGIVWVVPVAGRRIGVPVTVESLLHPADAEIRAAWCGEIEAAHKRRRELKEEAEKNGAAFSFKPLPEYAVEQAGKRTYASMYLHRVREVHDREGGLLVQSVDGGKTWQPVEGR